MRKLQVLLVGLVIAVVAVAACGTPRGEQAALPSATPTNTAGPSAIATIPPPQEGCVRATAEILEGQNPSQYVASGAASGCYDGVGEFLDDIGLSYGEFQPGTVITFWTRQPVDSEGMLVQPTPTPVPTPEPPTVTQIVIDGRDDDWENYDVVGTDPPGDHVPGSPDLAEIRAFSNNEYFYLLISQHEDGDTNHYDIMMGVGGGYGYDYQLLVSPGGKEVRFATLPYTGASLLEGVTVAQDEVIEIKMPLSAVGDQSVQRVGVHTYLGDREGDTIEHLQAVVTNETEPAVAAQPPTPIGPVVNATTSGTILRDEIWRGEMHLTGDITLDRAATLIIEPGTIVYIASNSDDRHGGMGCHDDYIDGHNDPVGLESWAQSAIIIDGRGGIISAVGTPGQPITFRPEGNSTSPGQWDGIRIERGTLQHAIVSYGGRTAVQISENSDGVEIAYNEVRNPHWCGIGAHGTAGWVHHNTVEGGGHQGIVVHIDSLAEHNLVIRGHTGIAVENGNNAVVRNNIAIDCGEGMSVRNGESAQILNNTIVRVHGRPNGWYYQGMLIYPASSARDSGIDDHIPGQVSILNNIICGPFDSAIGLLASPAHGSQVDFNLIWNARSLYGGPGQAAAGPNNITLDPMFVGPTDFHLLPSSPAIDAGDPAILDPDGSPSDLGAYGGPRGHGW